MPIAIFDFVRVIIFNASPNDNYIVSLFAIGRQVDAQGRL
jgi:hypothetical protein